MGIAYRINSRKILEAVVYVAAKSEERDYHHILKVLFYADKQHLQTYGRPVTGDAYKKMDCGPVGSKAYDFLKHSEWLPSEEKTLAESALAQTGNKPPSVEAKRDAVLKVFSKSDIKCLDDAIVFCAKKSFDELCNLTHEEQAWKGAELNGPMDYRLFIDEATSKKDDLVNHIQETSPHILF